MHISIKAMAGMTGVKLAILVILGLSCTACAVLKREKPGQAEQAQQQRLLKSVCGVPALGAAMKRLEAGAATDPHSCRELLVSLGAL